MNFAGNFYYFKVWDKNTNELILDVAPYTKDGANGLYDKVSGEVIYINPNMVCFGETTGVIKNWVQVDVQPESELEVWAQHGVPVCVVTCNLIDNVSEPRFIVGTESAGKEILEKMNKLYQKGYTRMVLRVLTPDQEHIGYLDTFININGTTINSNPSEEHKFFNSTQFLMPVMTSYMIIEGGQIKANSSNYVVRISGWMIDRYTEFATTSKLNSYATTSSVLTKTNTTSYTPTSNYHPATKKYVDEAIKTSVTNVLESDY